MTDQEKIIGYLKYVYLSDAEKHYRGIPNIQCGVRSTREIADWCGFSLSKTRRLLWAAAERDEVDAFDGGASGTMGNPIDWQISNAIRSQLTGADNDAG